MTRDVEEELRSPLGYAMGRAALGGLEKVRVWPTVLNFELWLHVQADPEGDLAREVLTLLGAGDRITDQVAEDLAQAYLPRARLEAQVGEAGDALSAHLGAAAETLGAAQGALGAFGTDLARARRQLDARPDAAALSRLVDDLGETADRTRATTQVMERSLAESATEVRRLREALELARQEAATDGLSNLANRRAFDEELRRLCVDDGAAPAGPACLALLDIDHFKQVNDSWGHQTGDQVIRFVASTISKAGAPPRFAARFGGDEFALIFRGEPASEVEGVLGGLIRDIAGHKMKRRDTGEPLGEVTLSAGFAERRPGETPAALMERADQALYASKRAGRNRVTAAVVPLDRPAPTTSAGARQRVLRAMRG